MKLCINMTIAFILFYCLLNSRCSKESCTPACIIEQIAELSNNNIPGEASIKEYAFQNQIVYFIDPGSYAYDQAYDIINSSCELVGYYGGFAGITIINGEDFDKKAKLLRIVWKR